MQVHRQDPNLPGVSKTIHQRGCKYTGRIPSYMGWVKQSTRGNYGHMGRIPFYLGWIEGLKEHREDPTLPWVDKPIHQRGFRYTGRITSYLGWVKQSTRGGCRILPYLGFVNQSKESRNSFGKLSVKSSKESHCYLQEMYTEHAKRMCGS